MQRFQLSTKDLSSLIRLLIITNLKKKEVGAPDINAAIVDTESIVEPSKIQLQKWRNECPKKYFAILHCTHGKEEKCKMGRSDLLSKSRRKIRRRCSLHLLPALER